MPWKLGQNSSQRTNVKSGWMHSTLISIRTWNTFAVAIVQMASSKGGRGRRALVGLIRRQTRLDRCGGSGQIKTVGHCGCVSASDLGVGSSTFPPFLRLTIIDYCVCVFVWVVRSFVAPVHSINISISLQYLHGVYCKTVCSNFWRKMASGGLTCVKYITFFCNLLFAVR